jgi:predicted RecA/RadA family phage recombinase
MKNFVYDGDTIEVTAPYTQTSGGGMKVGTLFGVCSDDVVSGAVAEILTEGVFDLAKDTSVFAQGDKVYWDDTNKVASSTASGNVFVGRAIAAALTGDATARVLLNESGLGRSFISAEQTGTGSPQNIAHGLGVIPTGVLVAPTDTAPSTTGAYTVTEGTHTTTNVVVTVTLNKKFKVMATA